MTQFELELHAVRHVLAQATAQVEVEGRGGLGIGMGAGQGVRCRLVGAPTSLPQALGVGLQRALRRSSMDCTAAQRPAVNSASPWLTASRRATCHDGFRGSMRRE